MPSLNERVATLEAVVGEHGRRIDGHARALFADGKGGVVGDLLAVSGSHAAHVKATDEVLRAVTEALRGALPDLVELKRAAGVRHRVFWLLLGAVVVEGVGLLVLLLWRFA